MWNLTPGSSRTSGRREPDIPVASGNSMSLFHELWGLGYAEDDGHLAWLNEALCAETDPDIFFPEKGGSTAPATSVCQNCTVREECLEYALSHDIRHGIWGGMSDNDRRKLSRQRRRTAGER